MKTQSLENEHYINSGITTTTIIENQIKVDIQRGLQRFNQLFQSQEQLVSRQLQQMFEKYFILLWQSLPEQIQSMYYQGLTDIFEVVFASQINTQNIPLLIEALKFDCNTHIDLQLMFKDPYASFLYSAGIVKKLYLKTQFKFEYNNEISIMVQEYVNQFDPLLFMILGYVEFDVKLALLLKYTINCCLHVTDLYSVSFLLGDFYLNRSQQEQAFLIQSLLSVAARVVLPQYFNQNDSDQIYQYAAKFTEHNKIINEDIDTYYIVAMTIINQALPSLLSHQPNEKILILLINDIVKNLKTYMKRKCCQ
ncbi:Conserved_hypothetical protein [Hexamita inflata]|uniref:Uncharacterized protein n=1 Tax=Hexamita inflata TaxID=28002 RepID=A0AA86NYL2_9EUKA|nr:Conserved hypothetical protein [Hexamita inflata]